MKKKSSKSKKKKSSRKASRPRAQNKPISAGTSAATARSTTAAGSEASAPPKKTPVKAAGAGGAKGWFLSRYVAIAVQFLREARTELKKVKWPTRKELFASTAVVIVLTLFVALYLGLVDFGLMKLIKGLIG